jgi:DNA-binding NarL/FixJ family response regulator
VRVFSAPRTLSMLAAPTPIFLGIDSRSRRLRLAQLVDLHPDVRLLGHTPVDHSCLRATIARRPEVLVLAPAAGRAPETGHLVVGVRRGNPSTTILALIDTEERPASLLAGELSADRFLPAAAPLDQVLRAVLDAARARRAVEAAAHEVMERRRRNR